MLAQPVAPAMADPVAQPIAGECAERGAGQRIGAVDVAGPTSTPTANSSGSAGTTMPTTASASQNAIRKIKPPAATGCALIHAMLLSISRFAICRLSAVDRARLAYTVAMHDADAIEIQALKADSFGRIALMRDAAGPFVRRDLRHVPLWLRLPAWWLARREAQALRCIDGLPATPQLLRWNGRVLDRSYLDGAAMYQRPPRGDVAYFRDARRLLQQLHRARHRPQRPGQGSQLAGAGRRHAGDHRFPARDPRPSALALDAPAGARGPAPPAQAQAHVLPAGADAGRTAPAQAPLVAARRVVRDRQAGLSLRDAAVAALGRQRRARGPKP